MRPASLAGLALIGALAIAWLVAAITPYDVVADVHPSLASAGPDASAWLGRDHLGRSVAMRLLHATEAFVVPGLVAAGLAGGAGGLLGAAGGWIGGWAERGVAWAFTVIGAVPRLILVLLAGTIFGAGVWVLAVAAGVACCPEPGMAVLGRITALKRAEFVTAARAHGVPPARILWYHLLWVNCRAPLLRQMAQVFGFFLVIETTLSYLGGFGVPEPAPSWGNMLAFEFGMTDGNPWAVLAPAACIGLVSLAVAWVGTEAGRRDVG